MTLAAGRLRHRVDLLSPGGGQDPDTGELLGDEFVMLAENVAAEVVPVSVREFVASQAVQSQVTTRVTIRYRDDVTARHRVRHRGKIYEIVGPPLPDPDSGLEYLTLACSEVVPQVAP